MEDWLARIIAEAEYFETRANESDKNKRSRREEAWEGKANVLIKFREVVSFVWLRYWLTLLTST